MTARTSLRSRMASRLRRRLAPQLRLLYEEAGLSPNQEPAQVQQVPPAGQVIELDYPVDATPRWGYSQPAHPLLHQRIDANRARYAEHLEQFLKFTEFFLTIPRDEPGRAEQPHWHNGMFPGLDVVSLYSFLVLTNPMHYIEVGSGNSTKVARLAIREHGLRTTITSIDPHPRAEIDALCDRVIRGSLEHTSLELFNELDAGDILFLDGSHRTLMNSDVTVAFLEVLPALRSGVRVQIHDIELPWDYGPEWASRYYSEQYLLAAFLLAKEPPFDVVLPNAFISRDEELAAILHPLWTSQELTGVETHGGSFWVDMR